MSAVETHSPKLLAALHARCMDRGRVWSEREFAVLLETIGSFAFVAPEPDPLGMVLGWVVDGDAEILTIAVAPDARRAGLGRILVDAAVLAAREGGAGRLLLEVAANNAPARALYAAASLVQIGVRKGYYDAGATDALVLARSLR